MGEKVFTFDEVGNIVKKSFARFYDNYGENMTFSEKIFFGKIESDVRFIAYHEMHDMNKG